jgi:HK97 family phage portal protein
MNLNPLSWLRSFGTKANTVAPLIYAMFAGQSRGVWTKRNFTQYSDDAYKRNVVAYKCINAISRGAAKVPLRVMIGDKPAPDSHPLALLLAKPNPFQHRAAFIESVFGYWLLSGNSYVEGVGPDNSPPKELWSHRPDRMKVIPGEWGPAGYHYEINGRYKNWGVDPLTGGSPILHYRFFNPLDDWYGMSPIEAAAYAVDAHNMAGEWNQGLLQNAARPSGALLYKPAAGQPPNLGEAQFLQLKEELNAAYSGTRNAGRPMLLEGGLEWQAMSLTPAEMDWINGKMVSAREICTVFDVPPMILGIPGDNTYSNYQEARQALYQDVVLPHLDNLLDGLNGWLSPAYGSDVRIEAVTDSLPALAEVRAKRWASVQNCDWMTTNEKRIATGLPPYKSEDADVILVPSGMVPLDGITEEPDVDETGDIDLTTGKPKPKPGTVEADQDEAGDSEEDDDEMGKTLGRLLDAVKAKDRTEAMKRAGEAGA